MAFLRNTKRLGRENLGGEKLYISRFPGEGETGLMEMWAEAKVLTMTRYLVPSQQWP